MGHPPIQIELKQVHRRQRENRVAELTCAGDMAKAFMAESM